jgi:anti-sigma-K factor RskA
MKVTADMLKDYVFGELAGPEKRAVEQAIREDAGLREEYERLRVTETALFSVREEEMPRRIAFVSDKVFAPKWYHAIWNAGPRLGFAGAALVAGALVFHAVWRPVERVETPVTVAAQMSQAEIDKRVSERVAAEMARLLPAAVERLDSEHKVQMAAAVREVEKRSARERQEELELLQANFSLWQQKMSKMYMAAYRSEQ